MVMRLILNFAILMATLCFAIFASGGVQAAIVCIPPPVLSSPLSYTGKCPGESGFPTAIKANGRDVYIALPTNKTCSGSLTVAKARNVRIVGGHFVFNGTTAVITIKDSSGTAFLDGLYIDVNKKYADAIRTYNHKGSLIVQNTFVRGISGTKSGTHGDLVHAQNGGPLQQLTLQNVTGYTGYQGLFAPYRPGTGHGTRALKLERVNVAYDPNVQQSKSLKLLYLGHADNATDRVPDLGSTFSSVYVDGSYWKRPYYKTVYAEPMPASSCSSFDAKHKISGQVCDGRPAGGDYVPPSQVGTTYNRSYFCY